MFDRLGKRLDKALGRFRQRGILTEPMIRKGLREVRRALLEADVNFKVTRDFLKRVEKRAVGEGVIRSISPGQQVVKIVHDELAGLLGEDVADLTWARKPPTVILMAGLQGSGKTTTAVKLAHLHLRYGGDSGVLDDLFQKDRRHPAYRRALTILVRALRDSGAEIPERLRRWEQEPGEVQGRWTPERTRDYLVGLTVDAMDTGRDKFIRHRDPVRGRLERDVNRLYAKAGKPSRIPEKDLVAALNAMKHGKWKCWNNGRGLTESDLRELRKPPASGELHGIMPDTKVRTSFPNLPLTRNHAAKAKISICDAVAITLEKGKQKRSYEAVVSMYRRYKTELPVL